MKIYLDTNVISGLCEEQNHYHNTEGRKFLERALRNEHELYISSLVLDELALDLKNREKHFENIRNNNLSILDMDQNIEELTKLLLLEGVLTKKHLRDLTHISFAITFQMDYLVSWNFDDIVNTSTIKRIRLFCLEYNLKNLDIHNPMEIK